MAYVDYTNCPVCDGNRLKVIISSSLNEGSVECEDCKFESDITRGGWIIEKTGNPLDY